jgi:hypothetical protein
MTTPRVLAVMVAYNEADIIAACLSALAEQGCDAYLIDHGSTDGTAEIAREFLGRGLVGLERFPEDSGFPARNANEMVWVDLLRRREQVVGEHDYDWYVLNDADEFREAPWPGLTFAEGLGRAEELGFNAVSFRVLDFRPVDGRFAAGTDPRAALTGWEHGNAVDAAQVKAFKRPANGSLDIVNRAGHDVRFDGRRVCPVQFILRHYPIRSPEHGVRKVLKERLPRFAAEERKAGWHVQYDELVAGGAKFVWEPSELTAWDPAAVRADLLAHALEQLLLATTVRGDDIGRLAFDDDKLKARVEARIGLPVTGAEYAAARHAFHAVARGEDIAAAAAAAGAASELVPEMLRALVAQVEVSGDPLALAHAKARLAAFEAAISARPVALEGARSFVTLVHAEELIETPDLAGEFAGAFDASSDATLVIHAPGWSDEQVAERLVPALAVLDGPAAPDAMALTASLDERALASSVHAVLTRREDVLAGVPHVTAAETLRDLALNLAAAGPITGS